MNSVEKGAPRRPLVADLNPNLMCRLCGGYYVDAAAIIECLHTFCKSCLVRYLETNKYCPVCDVQVHKSRPLQNIRLDPTLQDMVYKLVPGLYHKEMKCRREFYATRADAPPSSLEDRGDIPPELCPFYAPDEPVSLVLEYTSQQTQDDPTTNFEDSQHKRFLRCPAAVKVTHLEKLLRNKYGLDNRYNIDLMLEDSKLAPDLTLMDVAYAYGRKRKGQFLFTYRIYDTQCKKMRLSGDVCEMDTLPPLADAFSEVKKEVESEKSVDAKLSSSEPLSVTTSTSTCVVTSLPAPVMTTPSVTTPVSSASLSVPLNSFSNTMITPIVISVSPASCQFTCGVTSATPAVPTGTNGASAITAVASVTPVAVTAIVAAAPATTTAASGTTEPAPITTAPAPTTTAPASTIKAPAATITAPAPTTAAPALTTRACTSTTTAPASTIKAPAATITAPAPTTAAPALTTRACTSTTTAPASTTTVAIPTTTAVAPTATAAAPTTTAVAPTSTTAAPTTTVATLATVTSTSAMTAVAPATSAVATSTMRAAPSTSTLTITPVTTSSTTSTKSNATASSLLTTTAPSLKVSVQRLNPATVKSVTGKSMPEKTTNSTAQPSVTSVDKSTKLDSIISRLGDASKHPRPEGSLGLAPKKDYSSSRKPQGKEVQLRISENGEMITNVVHADKSPPLPKSASPLRPASPAVKPTPKTSHSSKSSENSTSSESAPKQAAIAPPSPGAVATPRKPNSSPVGYKTLKSGPKGWNPTISRNSFLSAKLEQQQQQQLQKAQQLSKESAGGPAKSPAPEPVVKPPRFFKARNTPRYLGNPSSGVKPMYQIASPPPSVQKTPPSKPAPKPPNKPSGVLKLDPKTLTPIMTSVASTVGSPTSQQTTQGKDRPPFLSTTISNHSPSSRGVTTTSTSATENSSKMSSAELAMRNAPNPHPIMRFLSMCDPMNPFSPRLGDPNRIPTSPPYASLLRAPFSPLLVNSYGLSQPPPVGMLYNQSLHRQVNHTGPLSPVPGLPSPLPPTSSLLPPSSSPKNVLSPVQWGPASPCSPTPKVPVSPQPVPNKKSSTEVQPKTVNKQAKLNGEKSQVKDKGSKDVPVKSAADLDNKEGERKATSVKETSKETKGPEQDNNNTVVMEKKSLKSDESVVEQSLHLSHNISKLCSPAASAKESSASKVHSSPADQVATVKVKQS